MYRQRSKNDKHEMRAAAYKGVGEGGALLHDQRAGLVAGLKAAQHHILVICTSDEGAADDKQRGEEVVEEEKKKKKKKKK